MIIIFIDDAEVIPHSIQEFLRNLELAKMGPKKNLNKGVKTELHKRSSDRKKGKKSKK